MKYLPRILYVRILSKHGDSPAVTCGESDVLWKLRLSVCRLCNLALRLIGQITEGSYAIRLPNWCQTVDLDIDRYVVSPPYVRPHFSYLSILLILVLGSWCLTVKYWHWSYILF